MHLWELAIHKFIHDVCPNRGKDEEKLLSFLKWIVSQKEGEWWYLREDEIGNLAIHIPGTESHIWQNPIVFQGHLDMVLKSSSSYDFETLWIQPEIQWDYITSKDAKTTLWADCGIMIAMALALAESKEHPPLALILTRQEETTMEWAKWLDPEALEIVDAEYIINLDNNISNQICVGAGGGVSLEVTGKYYEQIPRFPQYTVSFSGLLWGHSGEDIGKDKGRMHIFKEGFWFLRFLYEKWHDFDLVSFNFWEYENEIPEKGEVMIWFPDEKLLKKLVKEYEQILKDTYPKEEKFTLTADKKLGKKWLRMGREFQRRLVHGLSLDLVGEIDRNEEFKIPRISNNIGMCKLGWWKVTMKDYGRLWGEDSVLMKLFAYIWDDFSQVGLNVKRVWMDSAWKYDGSKQELTKIVKRAYTEVVGDSPDIVQTHSTLECGIIQARMERVLSDTKREALQIISIWPDILDEHSTKERLSISSVHKMMEVIEKVFEILRVPSVKEAPFSWKRDGTGETWDDIEQPKKVWWVSRIGELLSPIVVAGLWVAKRARHLLKKIKIF